MPAAPEFRHTGGAVGMVKVFDKGKDVTDYIHLICDYMDTEINRQSSYVPIYIDKRYIEIASPSATKIEDGTPLTNPTVYMVEGTLIQGHSLEAVVEGKVATVGSKPNKIAFIAIFNENGDDVTDNYNIIPRMGTLTILPDE